MEAEVSVLLADPAWRDQALRGLAPAHRDTLLSWRELILYGYLSVIALAVLARWFAKHNSRVVNRGVDRAAD